MKNQMYALMRVIFMACLLNIGSPFASGQVGTATRAHKTAPPLSAPHMHSQHREILQNWLAGKPGWRPAVEDDAYAGSTKSQREFLKGEIQSMTNHPFYVAADFNKDGKQDFAVMLVRRSGRTNKFAMVIFNSTYGKQKIAPAFYTEQVSKGDLLFWMDGNLLLSPPASDSGNIIKPRGSTYILN